MKKKKNISRELEKLEKNVEKEIGKIEKWVVERRKFFVKLSVVILIILLFLVLSFIIDNL